MAKVFVVETMAGKKHQVDGDTVRDGESTLNTLSRLGQEGAYFKTDKGGIAYVPPQNIARVMQVEEEELTPAIRTFRWAM